MLIIATTCKIVLSTNSMTVGSLSRGNHMLSIRPWAVVESDAILIVDNYISRVNEYWIRFSLIVSNLLMLYKLLFSYLYLTFCHSFISLDSVNHFNILSITILCCLLAQYGLKAKTVRELSFIFLHTKTPARPSVCFPNDQTAEHVKKPIPWKVCVITPVTTTLVPAQKEK